MRPGQFVAFIPRGQSTLPSQIPASILQVNKEEEACTPLCTGLQEKEPANFRAYRRTGIAVPGRPGSRFPPGQGKRKDSADVPDGGINCTPILNLARQLNYEKEKIIVGYRD